MGCPFEFFAEDLTYHGLIDRIRGAPEGKLKSVVDHDLTTVACAFRKIPELIKDIGRDVNGDSLRHAPSKTREPRIIAIESDPLTAGLHG